jgi:transcriptional antiterminator NusG
LGVAPPCAVGTPESQVGKHDRAEHQRDSPGWRTAATAGEHQPGYVLVQMDLTGFRTGGEGDHVWHVVKSTPRVTGFVGTANDPTPLTEDEVNQIIYRVNVGKDKPKIRVKFEKNETVRITDGPFANFNGMVDEVNEDRETLKVMVTIFGRATPVELEFGQVEKVA